MFFDFIFHFTLGKRYLQRFNRSGIGLIESLDELFATGTCKTNWFIEAFLIGLFTNITIFSKHRVTLDAF